MSATIRAKQAQLIDAFTRERPWKQILLTAGVFVALMLFVAIYYKQTFVGLTDRHSMDIAQVACNMATERGFTTRLIRPLNVALCGEQGGCNREINSAPAFPCAVAAMFKLRSPSDQCVAWGSVLFFLMTVASTYFLGLLLFDRRTGLLASAVLGISEPVLRAARSGTEWTLAAFLFTMILLAVAKHHKCVSGQGKGSGTIYAAVAAVLLAMLYMTNHVLLFLAIPLAVYFGATGTRWRAHLLMFSVVALVAVAPWAFRNATVANGSILGANAWDLLSHTGVFPGDQIYRSTSQANLSLSRVLFFPIESFSSFAEKLMNGLRAILLDLMPVLGLAVLPFAVVSMLYKFRFPAANAVRGFVYGTGTLLVVVFALFSAHSMAVVVLAPIIAVFGSAYFFLLLDAKKLHPIYARTAVAALVLITGFPALSAALWQSDVAEQKKALENTVLLADRFDAIMYTDVPWAIAWRTNGLGVWLPCTDEDVYTLESRGLPMSYAILTPECGKYTPDDTWYLLHRFQFWRDYLKDPTSPTSRSHISSIAAHPNLTAEIVRRELRENKRQLPILNCITGCTAERFRGLAPDECVLVTCPPRG